MPGRPTRILSRARQNAGRALRVITRTLSPQKAQIRRALPYKILVGTHHRAGTMWIGGIFRKIARHLVLEFFSGPQRDLPRNFDIFFQNHSVFDLEALPFDYRGVHVIRDPRDVIVSGCFYHQNANEAWLHVRRKEFGGLTYQEKIVSLPSVDEQLLFEMEYHGDPIWDMVAWSYSNPNFLEVRYEDLRADNSMMLFRRIFTFLGFPAEVIPCLLQIAYDNSLFSGKVRNSVHVRSGDAGQWRKYFKRTHRARFVELFGDALIRLGYERNNDWVVAGE